jgi:UDP-glucose 4-epimerase
MNVLMSGGFGFIGSYLMPHLLSEGDHLGLITRRVPETFQEIANKVDCHVHDLSEPSDLRLSRSYDCFVHLAGALHSAPSDSADPFGRTLDVTRHCIDLCRRNGISRFIHLSTFQVYGTDQGFIDETTPVSPRNDYARAHVLAEQEVRQAQSQGVFDYVILRPTNGYGFSVHADVHRWSLVPSCFCRSAVEEQEIVLRTSGRQEKDFVHLAHVAGLTRAVCASFDRFKNQIVNLAGGTTHSILDLAVLVKTVYESTEGRSCAMRVLSQSPEAAEPLAVSRAKTAGLVPLPPVDLASEIVKTLSFLAA